MTDDKKRALKKFLHDYGVVAVPAVLLLAILGLLGLARVSALASVQNLSKINPLITSEQNELVASSGSEAVVKIPKDDDDSPSPSPSPSASPGGDTTQSPADTTKTSSGTAGSGSSSTGTSGGTGGSTASTNPPPAAQPFTAGIGQLSYTSTNNYALFWCSGTSYDFQAAIQGQNAPGTVTYRWVQSNGTTGQTQQIAFAQGDTSKTISYDWNITGTSGNYSVTLQLLTPSNQQKTLSFKQSC